MKAFLRVAAGSGLAVLAVGLAYFTGRMRTHGAEALDPSVQRGYAGTQTEGELSAAALKMHRSEQAKAEIRNFLGGNWPESADSRRAKLDLVSLYFQQMNPRELPQLVEEARALPEGEDKGVVLEAFARFLAGGPDSYLRPFANPLLALSLLEHVPDPLDRGRVRYAAFNRLAEDDPRRAIEEMDKLPASAVDPEFNRVLFGAMVRVDLAEAQARLNALPPGPGRREAVAGISAAMAATDPQAATLWVAGLPLANAEKLAALREATRAWIDRDPVAAINWAGTAPADLEVPVGAMFLNTSRAMVDPQFVADNFDRWTNIPVRNALVRELAMRWATGPDKNPALALEWLNRTGTDGRYESSVLRVFNDLTMATGEVASGVTVVSESGSPNYAAIVPLLDQVADPAVHQKALLTLADRWAAADPQAAAAWAETLPTSQAVAALNAIVKNWSKSDPAAALAYVQASGDPAAFAESAAALAQNLSASDPRQALAYAQGLSESAERTRALSNTLNTLGKTDFTSAWSYAAGLPAGDSRNAAMTGLVELATSKDPAQAVPLLDQFAPGPVQNSATRALAKTWVTLDPQAASLWMAGLPPGSQRNVAVVELLNIQAAKDPAMALQWADTITTPTTRANQIQRVINAWAKTDPAAALAAAESADLPAEQKAALVDSLRKAQPSSR